MQRSSFQIKQKTKENDRKKNAHPQINWWRSSLLWQNEIIIVNMGVCVCVDMDIPPRTEEILNEYFHFHPHQKWRNYAPDLMTDCITPNESVRWCFAICEQPVRSVTCSALSALRYRQPICFHVDEEKKVTNLAVALFMLFITLINRKCASNV